MGRPAPRSPTRPRFACATPSPPNQAPSASPCRPGLPISSRSVIHSVDALPHRDRRVDVAPGIVGNPELVFLDEPTTSCAPTIRPSEGMRTAALPGTAVEPDRPQVIHGPPDARTGRHGSTAKIVAQGGAAVVVLTTYETDTDILRAVEAGASGYLPKDASTLELAEAVRAVSRGETVLSPSVAGKLVRSVRTPAKQALSTREREVLKLVGQGMTNAEVGRALHISEATVKVHLARSLDKFGVSDRTAAVTTAISMGLLG